MLLAIAWWAYDKRSDAPEGGRTVDYYLGGRNLGWFVLVFTMLASAASAGTFVGGPGLVYQGGYGWVLVSVFQVPTAFIALALLGKKFAILSRKLDLVTVTDFLRHRYEHPAVVITASVGVVVFLVAYMVPQFVGGARVLQAVTGVNYNTLLIVFAGVVLIYTAFGGFLADAISDTLQGVIMLLGGVVLWIVLLVAAGGLGPINAEVAEHRRRAVRAARAGRVHPGDDRVVLAAARPDVVRAAAPGRTLDELPRLPVRAPGDGERPRDHGADHPRLPHHGPGGALLHPGARRRRHGAAADDRRRAARRRGRCALRRAAGGHHVHGRLDGPGRLGRDRARPVPHVRQPADVRRPRLDCSARS